MIESMCHDQIKVTIYICFNVDFAEAFPETKI